MDAESNTARPSEEYVRDRPVIPPGYGVEDDLAGMLGWEQARVAIDRAEIYWVASVSSGEPHLVPVHAAGLEGTIYAGGDPDSRWTKNLARSPVAQIGVEFEGLQVISRGRAILEEPGPKTLELINAQVERKYGFTYGPAPLPMWVLAPQTVIAFDPGEFAASPTRFQFQRTVSNRPATHSG